MVQKIKTLSHCSIKKLFKLSFNKLSVFISFLLFSCSSHLIQAEEIKPKNLKCGSNSGVTFFEKNGLFTLNDEDFNYKLRLIDKSLNKEDFNLIFISKPQNSGGYTLEIEKIIKKNNKHLVYFKENKPPTGSANLMAITSTYCFLKLNNLEKVEVFFK
jgi:hypothetical protein